MTGASEQGNVVRRCAGTRAYEYKHLTYKHAGGSRTGSGSPGDQSLANVGVGEKGWGLNIIPVLLCEGVDCLLLASLLALSKALVFSVPPATGQRPVARNDAGRRCWAWMGVQRSQEGRLDSMAHTTE